MMTRIEIYIERKDKTVIAGDAEIDNVYRDEILNGCYYIGEYNFSDVKFYQDIDDEIGRPLRLDEHEYVYEYLIERAIEEGNTR